MALGTWKVDSAENAQLQKDFGETPEGRKLLEAEAKRQNQLVKTSIGGAGPTITSEDEAALRYPHNLPMQNDSDYVSFSFFDYTPAFRGAAKNSGGGDSDKSLGAKYQQYSGSITDMNPAKGYKPIVLFMPQDIQGQYGASWGGASFGAFFSTLASAMAGGEDVDALANLLKNAGDDFKGLAKIKGYQAAVSAMNTGLGTNVSVSQLMQGVSGTIINPNIELMYEAPEMRGFQLRFKMMARSMEEGKAIRGIYNTFKKAMLPTFGGSVGKSSDGQGTGLLGDLGKSGALMTVPKIVQVQFMTGSSMNEYIPQYKPCAITQVDVTHTADGSWAAYEGGMPVATEMSITFKETKLIFADEITINGVSY